MSHGGWLWLVLNSSLYVHGQLCLWVVGFVFWVVMGAGQIWVVVGIGHCVVVVIDGVVGLWLVVG